MLPFVHTAMNIFRKSLGLLLLATLVVTPACGGRNEDHLQVSLEAGQLYQHPTVGGDDEGARIASQATHFATSEIRRDSSTGWIATYFYRPAAGFVGTDDVTLEVLSSKDGVSAPTSRLILIHFTVR